MSAANYQLNAQSIAQIGGALQQINADGTVNQAATQQMLSDLKTKLGGNFTQQKVSDNLHTDVVDGDAWYDQLFMTVVITGLSIMSGMAASAAIGAIASAASGTTFAAAVPATTTTAAIGAGTGNVALSAGFAGMMNSAMSQLNSGGSFSVGKMLETGGVAALTAGLTNGITFANGSVGWSWNASQNSLAALAGVQSVGNTLVPQAGAASGSLPTTITAVAAESVLQAGVQTAIQGGSFLTNLRNSAVSNAAAALAYTIGNLHEDNELTGAAYLAAHAALGCAAGAATGQGCGGGAIGAATSAAMSQWVIGQIDPSGAPLDAGQQAVLATIAGLTGGGLAGLAGQNALAGSTAAQNEALNNSGGPGHIKPTSTFDTNGGEPGLHIDAGVDTLKIQQSGVPTEQQQENGDLVVHGGGGAPIAGSGGKAGATNTTAGSTPMISGVTVVDQRTGTVYQGTVDLQPTLDRIANGGAPLSKNDGTVFQNRPVNGVQLLPVEPAGYYTEYVVPTPGINGPGPQRIVTGKGGEIYYTPDHYQSFIPMKK